MKIKKVIYVIMIITGILIEKYGLESTNQDLEKIFGAGAIIFGTVNIVIDYLFKRK